MEKYRITISKAAENDLEKLYKSGKKIDINKVERFFNEIENNPREGTGFPEQLKRHIGEVWSRRINKKDRFVYEVFEEEVIIIILQSIDHYDDK